MSSLKVIVSGAAPLPVGIAREVETTLNVRVCQGKKCFFASILYRTLWCAKYKQQAFSTFFLRAFSQK